LRPSSSFGGVDAAIEVGETLDGQIMKRRKYARFNTHAARFDAECAAPSFRTIFTTKPVGTGTGLGLVISNRIVGDRHGGEIEFESKPGETRFKVRLPLKRSPN